MKNQQYVEYKNVILKFVKDLNVYEKHKAYIVSVGAKVGVDVNSKEIQSFLSAFTEDEYVKLLTDIYIKHFTLDEIIEVVNWQTSELGRKCVQYMHIVEEELYMEMTNFLTLVIAPVPESNNTVN